MIFKFSNNQMMTNKTLLPSPFSSDQHGLKLLQLASICKPSTQPTTAKTSLPADDVTHQNHHLWVPKVITIIAHHFEN